MALRTHPLAPALALTLAVVGAGCPKGVEGAPASSTTPTAGPRGPGEPSPASAPAGGAPVAPARPAGPKAKDLPPLDADDAAEIAKALVGKWRMSLPGPDGKEITQTLVFTDDGKFSEINAAGDQTRRQEGTFRVTAGSAKAFALEIQVPVLPRPVTNVYGLADDGTLTSTLRDREFKFTRVP